MITIKCAYNKLVPISDLKPHPKNRNKHPKEQIERLSEIIKRWEDFTGKKAVKV